MKPTLTGYGGFLSLSVGIPQSSLPPFSGTGTLEEGSSTLIVVTVAADFLVEGAILSDAAGAIPSCTIVDCPLDAEDGGVGTYRMSAEATATISSPETITATNPWVVTTFQMALSIVNRALQVAPRLYRDAVYNLATDRLYNWATDQPNQTYFAEYRKRLHIPDVAVGVPTAANDQGTSVGMLNPEQLRQLTLQDLQTLKTPWGRTYLGIAQSYGSSIWGLS